MPIIQFLLGPVGRWLVGIAFVVAAIGVAYLEGHHKGYVERVNEDAVVVAAANEQARAAENIAEEKIESIQTSHQKELSNAQANFDRRMAAYRNGAFSLSVPVTAVPACTNPGSPRGPVQEARAELTAEAGNALESIAEDGDNAIRQSNALIDAYAVALATCGK